MEVGRQYQGRRRSVAAGRPRRRGAGSAREGAAPWPPGQAPGRGARRWSGSFPPTGTWHDSNRGIGGVAGAAGIGIGRNRREQSRPVPDAELKGVRPAVGAGAEGIDAPLRQPGDGLHAGVRPARTSGPAAAHRRARTAATPVQGVEDLMTQARGVTSTKIVPFFLSVCAKTIYDKNVTVT
jgi:hypothetical protein